MSRFKIGQEVICVEGNKQGHILKGKVYTIFANVNTCCNPAVSLKEINTNGISYCRYCGAPELGRWHWSEDRFEPVKYDNRTKELAETMVEHLGGVKKEVEHIKI